MKIKNIVCVAALLLASLSAAKAQTSTPISTWTFDNDSTGFNASPAPSTGLGTASAVGFSGNSSQPAIVSLTGSSTGSSSPLSWQFSAASGTPNWSTSAPIGTQGAQFSSSTVGFYQIQVSFDVNATANAEGALQVQYTTGNSIWYNATITSVGSGGIINNNSMSTNDLVVGSYLSLSGGWNNQVTVNLTGISQVDDAPDFAIRIVNASTGTNCLDTTGTLYNNGNTTAAWTIDNFNIQGVPYTPIADWPFDNDFVKKGNVANSPAPAIANNFATNNIIGFNFPSSFVFADGSMGSTNFGDITANGQPYSSTGAAGQYVWRLRGQNPGNGWTSKAPIGTQGAEFDVSTINYSNIVVTFDLYMTSQGEAKMCVLYTTNAWATTNVADNLSYGLNETLIQDNTNAVADPNTVAGTYFYNDYGSIFFNYMVVDFTGSPNVDNNPNFAFRIVNAATGFDCVNYLGQAYNNSSGNSRVDNVAVNGQFEGQYPPTVTPATGVTVDNLFTNTFPISTLDSNWSASISSIYVNGIALTNKAYTITASNIVFNPAKSSALEVSGQDSFVIFATGFATAKYTQVIATGKATQLIIQQPAGPSASSGTLTINPYVELADQYTNGTSTPYTSMVVTASVSNSPATWVLGGSTVQPIVNGFCMFTDLTATVTGSTAISNAAITFSITGYTNALTTINSSNFVVGKPPVPFTPGNLAVLQIDTLGNNTTFSIIELHPSAVNQTVPVNVVPISATGTNGLRLASAGSCGKLALSDDLTHLVFAAFQDNSSATADETFNLNRAGVMMSSGIQYTSPVYYVSQSFGGSQARSACSPDNTNVLVDDKGGLYADTYLAYVANNVSVRSFGGSTNLPGQAWVLTAKTATPPTPSMYEFAGLNAPALDWSVDAPENDYPIVGPTNPPPDGVAQDFYMIGTNIAYICDQGATASGTNGVITKWVQNNDGFGDWTDIGSWTNYDNCDTLFATTNGSGGVYLYYANGGGGSGGNQIIRLTDQSVNGSLNIISTNVIYTASANTSVEGIVFVPQSVPYTNELTPPPILTAATAVSTSAAFTITNTPDDPAWRSGITSVTVNGTLLPTAAYNANVAGGIVFDPTQSGVLAAGSDTIAIAATGYSTDSIVQVVGGFPVPIVTTLTASNVTAGTALMDASVNPNGGATSYWFQYGTNTNYGSVTTTKTLLAGSSPVIVTNLVTGLLAGTTYHYLVVATNTTGSALGSDSSFTTLTVTPPNTTTGSGGSVTLTGTTLTMAFTNTPGTSFSVLGTNIITAPVSTWPVVGHATENPVSSGNYSVSIGATNSAKYYILRNP